MMAHQESAVLDSAPQRGSTALSISPLQPDSDNNDSSLHSALSQSLRINPEEGFFHAMLSYRVKPDQDYVTKIHDKTHMIHGGSSGRNSETRTQEDNFPWPKSFRRHDAVTGSSLNLFQDSYCLKEGMSWEGDGGTLSGGFVGALRISIVFVPIFSASQQGDVLSGSVGQMVELNHVDKQDNVLLELVVARELHLMSQRNKTKELAPCSYILPLFRSEFVWEAAGQLPKKPSSKTNAKALSVMLEMGFPVSDELQNGSLTVADVWSFYTQFQGVKLYDYGTEKSEHNQIDAAARSIIRVVSSAMSERTFRLVDMNCAQLYELFDFLSELNVPYYTSILASHKITSVSQLAFLGDHSSTKVVKLIAEKGCRNAHVSSMACELVKLRAVVAAAKASPLSKSLNSRFENFIDSDASLVTVLQSTCLFEIVFSKKVVLAVAFVFCVAAVFYSVSSFFDPSKYTAATKNTFIVNQSISFGFWVNNMLALIIAHVKSPRQGKYWLSFSFFYGFLSTSIFYGLDVHSAAHDGCRECTSTNPEILALKSAVLNVLNLPCWPPVMAAIFICMLYKQQLTVPVTLYTYSLSALTPIFVSIFSVPTASNVVFTLTSGGYNAYLYFFWLLVYFMFRMFLRKGNQHALDHYYKRNATTLNKTFQKLKYDTDGLRFLTCHQQPLEAVPTHSSHFRRMFVRCQQALQSPRAHLSDPLLFRDAGSYHLNTRTHSAEFIEAMHKLDKRSKVPVVQCHSSFETLIRDAEFINYPFQEWVSTWLNSGFDTDAARKYLQLTLDDMKRLPDESRSEGGISKTIRGFHVPGPVKHIDRAFAKAYRSYEGNFNRLTDMVRCSLVLDTPDDMIRFVKKLVAKAHVEEPKIRGLLSRAKELWTTLRVRVLGITMENDDVDPRTASSRGALKFFDLLRVRQPTLLALLPLCTTHHEAFWQVRNRFAEENPLGGYRDINVKMRVGFQSGPKDGRPLFCPVESWGRKNIKTMVVEIQLQLKVHFLARCLFREILLLLQCAAAASPCSDDLHQELHDCTESKGSNVHLNYIKARNMMSQ